MGQVLEQPSSTLQIVELAGEIDLANATSVGDELCEAIERADSGIMVDLTRVTFIDAIAVAMMVRIHNYANLRRRTVTWRATRPFQLRVFEITGVDRFLTLDV